MPKAYKRRSSRSTPRSKMFRRYRALDISIPQLVVIALLLGLLLTGTVIALRPLFSSLFLAPSPYSVVGPPTITPSQINLVLAYYHSPAQGKGQALYDDGKSYNIDPAFALAFFMHESLFGTKGVATTTHSLGNIRATPGYPSYHGYRSYASWEDGFENWYSLISQQYVSKWGLSTVDQIIPVYAPAADHNNEIAYIQSVKKAVDTWRAGGLVVSSS
jgi:hypothetical protein